MAVVWRTWVLAAVLLVGGGPMPASVWAQEAGPASESAPESASEQAPAYHVFTGEGDAASLEQVVAAAGSVDVVFVGEIHDDPGAHALQDTLFARLIDRYRTGPADSSASSTAGAPASPPARPVALSMEMLERDVQPVVDEYLAGRVTERHFADDARVWSNYASGYRPLVERARRHGLPVLAANAPRRYVNRVARLGPASLDSLSAWAKQWLPPLPYPSPSPAYRAKWMDRMRQAMPHGHGAAGRDTAAHHGAAADSTSPARSDQPSPTGSPQAESPHAESPHAESPHTGSPHGGMRAMLQAQALWDATMGYTIAQHLTRHPGALVLHVTGAFHVSGGTGTPEMLRHYRPGTRALVITVRPTSNPATFDDDHRGQGAFVVQTPDAP